MTEGNRQGGGQADSLIRFACNFCGQHIRIPKIHAGKKGKCPKCGKTVLIPKPPAPKTAQDDEPIRLIRDSGLLIQNTNPTYPPPAQTPLTEKQQLEMLRDAAGLPPLEPPAPPQRKSPAITDIWLYPANIPGLIFLGIAILIPLAITILSYCLGRFAGLISMPAAIINAIIGAYIYWYLAQCVCDSAAGNIRAPETLAETPGLWELVWQLLEIGACIAVCAAPASAYFGFTSKTDLTFWLLAGAGAFLYPMMLLGVLMFNSINGLNPLIIIPSIFSTFFQYCGLVILIGALICLLIWTQITFWRGFYGFVFYPVFQAVELYLAMIAAHLLGRFYFKYQEKLNWEV
jgi:DNA-directed RNA polymerase subunit RPC12/RpoP